MLERQKNIRSVELNYSSVFILTSRMCLSQHILNVILEYTSCNANITECEHVCINLLHGGYRCMCRKGYQLALDGKHCLYRGECNPKTFHCDHSCRFINNEVKCQCRSGYVMMKAHDNKCKGMFK